MRRGSQKSCRFVEHLCQKRLRLGYQFCTLKTREAFTLCPHFFIRLFCQSMRRLGDTRPSVCPTRYHPATGATTFILATVPSSVIATFLREQMRSGAEGEEGIAYGAILNGHFDVAKQHL